MRISNVEWIKKRIGFIRKLGDKTTRQRQIIDLLDDGDSLSESDRRILHVLATAEKDDIQQCEKISTRRYANGSLGKKHVGNAIIRCF